MTMSTELTLPQRAAVALGSAEHETKLKELAIKHADIVDIKNSAGRDQCHAAMMTLANARVAITKAGKEARDDATKFSKAVIEEEKRLIAIIEPEESRLRALRDAWDEEREREKQAKAEAERQRVEGIRTRIEAILLDAVAVSGKSSAEIAEAASRIEAMDISINDFAEFTGQAQAKRDETVEFLRTKHAEAVAREEEAARLKAEREELDRLRAEAEAREREAAAKRAEEERQAREAREAEERRLAEARAAQEAELRAQREAQERELAAQRERQAAEAKRLAEERAALEHQQREAEEQRRREEAQARAEKDAADAQIRRTAPQMLDALMQWRYAEQTKDKVELENARKARDAAIEAATTVAEEVAA